MKTFGELVNQIDKDRVVVPTGVEFIESKPNPFSGSTPKPRGGFIRQVTMSCKCCGDTKLIPTDDFRLNWECDPCRELPVLLKIISKWSKSTGMIK
jgi:hypothetical protein